MLPVTPRATVVEALARREAELLEQAPASGHVLIALIWEGGGLAAHALTAAGLPKGAEDDLRQRLALTPDSERGVNSHKLLVLAARIAAELSHDHVGTEHLLLAIRDDGNLGEAVLARDIRDAASAWVREKLQRPDR